MYAIYKYSLKVVAWPTRDLWDCILSIISERYLVISYWFIWFFPTLSFVIYLYAMHSSTPKISYSTSSASLGDRSSFPSLFSTVPSEALLAPGIASFILNFEWRRVVLITQEEEQYVGVSTHMHPCACGAMICQEYWLATYSFKFCLESLTLIGISGVDRPLLTF